MRAVGCSRRWLLRIVNSRRPTGSAGCDLDFRDAGGRGRLRFQVANESVERRLGAFQVNLHAFFPVQNPAGQRVRAGQAIHERTKAYTLHHAADSNGAGTCHGYSERPRRCSPDPANRL